MTTAGAFIARLAEVAVSTTLGGSYTPIEKLKSPKLAGQQKTADSSNNDSGGYEENLPTWKTGTLSFGMTADESATGQELLWTSFLAGTQLFYRLRPRGDNSGDRQVRWQGTITALEEPLDQGNVADYNATIQMTGAPTRDTQ